VLDLVKAHAYGNDFLLTRASSVADGARRAWARRVCDRHTGAGADGLIFYTATPDGARMRLFNADGSDSELSGNGVRCLAAWVLRGPDGTVGDGRAEAGRRVVIETDAGAKTLELVEADGGRLTFTAAMGPPTDLRQLRLAVAGEEIDVVALRVGNPQCVALMPLPNHSRFLALGAALSSHEAFREGTNVELAEVASAERVRILIWERGVGPTRASGTGACAAAVAAAAHGGASRDVEIEAPGGTQRVVWREGGLELTGWAEIVWAGRWMGEAPDERADALPSVADPQRPGG
jgi:diaminopimelate epimerase